MPCDCKQNVILSVNECDPVQPPPNPPECVSCVEPEPYVPCVPDCRKSVKDDCRVPNQPKCCCEHPPVECVRKTKCKFYSVKDVLRQQMTCPPPKCSSCNC